MVIFGKPLNKNDNPKNAIPIPHNAKNSSMFYVFLIIGEINLLRVVIADKISR